MSKRFTETEKWRDSWFRKLPAELKVGYLYVIDNCDAAGVWDPDFDLADFTIGSPVDWDALKKALGDRLQIIKNGKWYVTNFITFQYGELSRECRPHLKVFSLLEGYQIPYTKGIHTQQDKEEDKDKEKDKDKGGGAGGGVIAAELVYGAYPRKVGKAAAIKAIKRILSARKVGADALLDRTQAYAAAVARWGRDDLKYVPHPATWYNRGSYEDDPATWERGNRTKGEFADAW